MCARITILVIPQIIKERFDIDTLIDFHNFNVAPTDQVITIIDRSSLTIQEMKWGLTPPWAKDETSASKLINARSETINEKRSFREAFRSKRCLILANGYYEWQKSGKRRTPMYIRLKNHAMFSFAGIYEDWTSPAGIKKSSCSIITTTPNELTEEIHDRMPVILPISQERNWIDSTQKIADLQKMLKPYSADEMEAYQVSTKVNTISNKTIANIEPINQKSITDWF
ncbi:MAG: SOS response-associated peptidase [Candidatus Heimdallarchaeota archaeon]|nr:SOS response-associated peptidase [Candidatus Heimdallarchaeota archaeon]MCK5048049.1 SOS response-associated peptidase [Candidatus Heimdallarchaeota archaeon]